MLIQGRRHLLQVLVEYVNHYDEQRPHRGLARARQRAQDKQAQSNIRNALTTEKTYYVDNQAYTSNRKNPRPNSNHQYFSYAVASMNEVKPTLVTVGTDTAGGVCLESESKSGSKFYL